ncbi:MAG: spermidine/putrescine ABC transporter substrate-binding protein, partial [Candidatus Poribacteria bacterium]|nr:spermidine/putrescine ABC transporter substrate-binding protein [Candidatus Poribacteria bacterium]
LAEQFINYLLRPEVNAKITAFTKYGTCVPTAKEFLPEHLREHKFIYPPKAVLESLEWLRDPGDFTRHYDRAWEEIKAK